MSLSRLCLRISCILAGAVFLSSCQTEPSEEEEARVTRVLMIGNSFSISLMGHLPEVAVRSGVDLDLASLYIGGCSLERHWQNVQSNAVSKTYRPYRFDRNNLGKYTESRINVCTALKLAKWDIVTVQQASGLSWQPESYRPYGDDLVGLIRKLAPQAEIFVQETWCYTPWDPRLKTWGIDPDTMYSKLHAAYAEFAERNELEVIPFGTAVQEWRRRLPVRYTDYSFGGDVVGGGKLEARDHFKRNVRNEWEPNCDVFHLNRRGEYFQALVWAARLFDADLAELDYRPDCVTEAEAKLMKEIAAR